MKTRYIIHTDGACKGNPGPGGVGIVINKYEGSMVYSTNFGAGFPELTTNNRMELTAVIIALKEIVGECGDVVLHTDSMYVVNGVNGWIKSWKRKGWVKKGGVPIANRDLWEELDRLIIDRKRTYIDYIIKVQHVRGHNGVELNELADNLASKAALEAANNMNKDNQ